MRSLTLNEVQDVNGGEIFTIIVGVATIVGAVAAVASLIDSSPTGATASKDGVTCGDGQDLHYSSDGTTTTASCTNGGG